MLSLNPNAPLNGRKNPATKISIISVVRAKSIKVLLRPCVKNDSFLVLQTNELKIWQTTTP